MEMMTPIRKQRTWDTDDRQLQSFLGLALWEPEPPRPTFGVGVKAPLRKQNVETLRQLVFDPETESFSGDEGADETEETYLTNVRLAWHYGHMDWTIGNVKDLLRKSKGTIQGSDFDERFFFAAEGRAVREFIARRVTPLSKAALALEYPLYVQSVPVRLLDLDLPTNRFFGRSLENSLCVLPANLRSAEHYNLTEPELRLFAPHVIWVINHRCSTFSIRTSEKFADAIDEWRPYVEPSLIQHLYDRSQKSRPYLLSGDVRQKLLL